MKTAAYCRCRPQDVLDVPVVGVILLIIIRSQMHNVYQLQIIIFMVCHDLISLPLWLAETATENDAANTASRLTSSTDIVLQDSSVNMMTLFGSASNLSTLHQFGISRILNFSLCVHRHRHRLVRVRGR